jgi:malate/lactate dehydrogenase
VQPNGLERNLGLPEMNAHEKKLLDSMLKELQGNIDKGVAFVKSN